MAQVECVVIGAGVVGLAVARALALAGREVLVLERHDAIGTETSARNSEVIHAGIYYPPGSAKARLCVSGKEALYGYCRERGVPHAQLGKLIVATSETQLTALAEIRERGRHNGAGELRWLKAAEVSALEPQVRCVAAVHSETTGVIDSHAYMLALQGDLEAAGGVVALLSEVTAIEATANGATVRTNSMSLTCRWLVNSGGLSAPALASASGFPRRGYYARGRYYTYGGKAPFERLIYPVPEPGGLGVHVTLDLGGGVRFGPDVEWLDAPSYDFDDSAKAIFADAIRAYYPDLEEARLQPGYTGVRPKISGPGEPAADFLIAGPEAHGQPGVVHLLGIESPGLTASLAIADTVAQVLSC